MIPVLIMYGISGIKAKIVKEKNVVSPQMIAEESFTTSPNYSSIIMLTKACELVAYSSAIRSDCSEV